MATTKLKNRLARLEKRAGNVFAGERAYCIIPHATAAKIDTGEMTFEQACEELKIHRPTKLYIGFMGPDEWDRAPVVIMDR